MIPPELTAQPQWVAWKFDTRGGKPTKLPVNPRSGRLASSTDKTTWATYDLALKRQQADKLAGIGFVFSPEDPYCGIDFDGCRHPETGEIAPWADKWIKKLDSYAEVSPSRTGVKVFVRAKWPLPNGKKTGIPGAASVNTKAAGVEVYDSRRYFAVTGDQVPGLPVGIEDRQPVLDELCATFFKPPEKHRPTPGRPRPAADTVLLERARRYVAEMPAAISGEGGHDKTFAVACALVCGFELSIEDAHSVLSEYNQRCAPPWSEAELRHKLKSADAQAGPRGYLRDGSSRERQKAHPQIPGAPPPGFRRTDSGQAELFASLTAGKICFDHRAGIWRIFRDHRWDVDRDGLITRLAQQAARKRFEAAANIENLDERRREATFGIQSEARGRIESALALARAHPDLANAGTAWDQDPLKFCVGNGVLQLDSGTLKPGLPSDGVTLRTAVNFDPAAPCPRWESFLEEIFEGNHELIAFVRRAAGYSLTGHSSEQALFLLYGQGANGKSLLTTILREVWGEHALNLPFSTIEMRERAAIPNDLAQLPGRRFVTASETNVRSQLNESRVKALTGGDPITARFLHSEFFTFRPVAKFWLSVNHKPRVEDDSYGFWRRVQLIPFNRQFKGRAADPHLEDRLRAELPGILTWAVEGCGLWLQKGLSPPECVSAATEQYRQDSDPIHEFLSECCIEVASAWVPAADFYRAYLGFADGRGMKETERLSSTAFGARVSQRFNRKRSNAGNVYLGVGLRRV